MRTQRNLYRDPVDCRANGLFKRTIDVTGSLLLLLVFLPVMAVCAFTMKFRRRIGGMHSDMPSAPVRLSCVVAHLLSGACRFTKELAMVYEHTYLTAWSQP